MTRKNTGRSSERDTVAQKKKKTVFISSITSDIGLALARRYSADGYIVAGTYRSRKLLPELAGLPGCHLFSCDLSKKGTILSSIRRFASLGLKWETFISCASWPPPLTGFFGGDFDEWSASVHVNAIEQLRVLHAIYPFRDRKTAANVVFFAGPGTNNAVKNFSALTLSKLMLIKACELLDAENGDLNAFIVGPGWTRTKTHDIILSDPNVSPEKYRETMAFLKTQEGTSMEDIYRCVRRLSLSGRKVSGGRNFSIVHDAWRSDELFEELAKDPDMYKLRRYRNEWKGSGKKNEQR